MSPMGGVISMILATFSLLIAADTNIRRFVQLFAVRRFVIPAYIIAVDIRA